MLLSRLIEYAGRDGGNRPLHGKRTFPWELALDAHGRPYSLELLPLSAPDVKGRERGAPHSVPSAVRAFGVAANLTADDAQYVFGWTDETTKPARVAQCHAAFVDLTRRWADSDAGRADPVAQAVAAFYRGMHNVERPEGCTAKSGVLITVAGCPAYEAESVPRFWAEEIARRKGASARTGLCLVCGTVGPLLDTLPGKVPGRLVPQATKEAALVSLNAEVFGYGLTKQLGASPICMTCGQAVTAGLVRALSSPYTASYGGQDSRMAWWTTEPARFDPMTMLDSASPEEVTTLLQSAHRGDRTSGPLDDAEHRAKFCSLSVGGNVARVVVRDWVEMPLGQVAEHVVEWFDDHEMIPLRPDDRRHHGIWLFTLASGRWLRDRNRYAEPGAKGADRPDGVQRDLTRAALRNTPLPPSLLVHLVRRVRTDGHLDDARAALLRLILTRHPHVTEKPMAGLDPDNTDPAYVAGRAFALLDQIQFDASGPGLNSTYADRHFAGAIGNPRAAIVSGRRDAIAWLKRLRRQPLKRGVVLNHEKNLDQLFGLIGADTSLPGRTTIEQQARFLLGYHHQRAQRFADIAAAKAARAAATPDEETDR